VLSFLLATRTDYSINIFRTPGLLYQEQPDNKVSNIYDLNIVNKTFDKVSLSLKLENTDGEISVIGNDLVIEPQEIVDAKFMVILSKSLITKMNTPLEIGIYNGDKLVQMIQTSLLGPLKKKDENEIKN
jgi:hypothetical protein